MKLLNKDIPEGMVKKGILPSKGNSEKDSVSILKELWGEEESKKKGNRRVTFFVNLIYIMSLAIFVFMCFTPGLLIYALPAMALTTLGAFIFNVFIYSESKRTKKQQDAINNFYHSYEHKQTNQGRAGSETSS